MCASPPGIPTASHNQFATPRAPVLEHVMHLLRDQWLPRLLLPPRLLNPHLNRSNPSAPIGRSITQGAESGAQR